MLAFLMGTHPRVGKESDIQILYLGRIQSRPLRTQLPIANPLSVICDILLSTDDQAALTEFPY